MSENDFRSNITWRPTKGLGCPRNLFSKSKVCQLDVPIKVNENILGLQISVDNVPGMEKRETEENLTGIKLSRLIIKSLNNFCKQGYF